jgi:phosphoribosyl-AMP cyclohydrolase
MDFFRTINGSFKSSTIIFNCCSNTPWRKNQMMDHSNRKATIFASRGTKDDIETGNVFCPKFDETGLIPCIVSEHKTGVTLMFAFMNAKALELTIETGMAHFWSRSRKELWKKGETSGNTQQVVEILTDCDQDAICLIVNQERAACHVGYHSCFHRSVPTGLITDPKKIILERKEAFKTFEPSEVYKHKV